MARPRPLRDVLNVQSTAPAPGNHARKRVSARKRPRTDTPVDNITAETPAPAPRRSLRVLHRNGHADTCRSSLGDTVAAKPTARPTKRRKAGPQASLPESSSPVSPAPLASAAAPSTAASSARQAEDEVLRAVLEQPPAVPDGPQVKDCGTKREVLVDWLMEVAEEYQAKAATLALAVNYMDRVLADLEIPREDLQLLAVTCMFIACKIEETVVPCLADVVFICDHSYRKEQVLAMEETVLNQLGFRLTLPTHMSLTGLIAGRISKFCQTIVVFFEHLAMMDDKACRDGPGVIALGCLYVCCHLEGLGDEGMEKAVGGIIWRRWKREACGIGRRLLAVWAQLKERHEEDQSRWMLIRWRAHHELLVEIDSVKEGWGAMECGMGRRRWELGKGVMKMPR